MADGESSVAGGIPDFFYELIARIIPGVVVIAISIYWFSGNFKTSSGVELSVFVFFGLVAAWIIGVTLDLGVFVGWKWFVGRKWLLRLRHYLKREEFVSDLIQYGWIVRKLEPLDRKLVTKAHAQIVFFRSMTAICAFAVLICLAMLCVPYWGFLLPALDDCAGFYALIYSILALVFWSCWKWQHGELEKWYKEEAKLYPKSSQFPEEPQI